jgi:hypothetical protein
MIFCSLLDSFMVSPLSPSVAPAKCPPVLIIWSHGTRVWPSSLFSRLACWRAPARVFSYLASFCSHSSMSRLNFLGSRDLVNFRACSASGGALVGSAVLTLSTAARRLSLNWTIFSVSFCLISLCYCCIFICRAHWMFASVRMLISPPFYTFEFLSDYHRMLAGWKPINMWNSALMC